MVDFSVEFKAPVCFVRVYVFRPQDKKPRSGLSRQSTGEEVGPEPGKACNLEK